MSIRNDVDEWRISCLLKTISSLCIDLEMLSALFSTLILLLSLFTVTIGDIFLFSENASNVFLFVSFILRLSSNQAKVHSQTMMSFAQNVDWWISTQHFILLTDTFVHRHVVSFVRSWLGRSFTIQAKKGNLQSLKQRGRLRGSTSCSLFTGLPNLTQPRLQCIHSNWREIDARDFLLCLR